MSAAVVVENTQHVAIEAQVAAPVVTASESAVLVGHDVARERELDVMAASIEGTAEGLGIFLLLALFGMMFVIATLTGVLA